MKGSEFNKVKPYVYWIKNNTTGIKYFGVRWGNLRKKRTPIQDLGKKYFTSGKLAKAFKKNPQNFTIAFLATFDSATEARDYEYSQTKKFIKNKRYANLASFPTIVNIIHPMKGRKHSEESRKKISLNSKGRKAWNKNRKLSTKHKKNISKNRTGKMLGKHNHFSKMKFIGKDNHFFGKKHSGITKKKISLKAQNMSIETRRKMSLAKKGKKKGPLPEETKRKISETKKRQNALKSADKLRI